MKFYALSKMNFKCVSKLLLSKGHGVFIITIMAFILFLVCFILAVVFFRHYVKHLLRVSPKGSNSSLTISCLCLKIPITTIWRLQLLLMLSCFVVSSVTMVLLDIFFIHDNTKEDWIDDINTTCDNIHIEQINAIIRAIWIISQAFGYLFLLNYYFVRLLIIFHDSIFEISKIHKKVLILGSIACIILALMLVYFYTVPDDNTIAHGILMICVCFYISLALYFGYVLSKQFSLLIGSTIKGFSSISGVKRTATTTTSLHYNQNHNKPDVHTPQNKNIHKQKSQKSQHANIGNIDNNRNVSTNTSPKQMSPRVPRIMTSRTPVSPHSPDSPTGGVDGGNSPFSYKSSSASNVRYEKYPATNPRVSVRVSVSVAHSATKERERLVLPLWRTMVRFTLLICFSVLMTIVIVFVGIIFLNADGILFANKYGRSITSLLVIIENINNIMCIALQFTFADKIYNKLCGKCNKRFVNRYHNKIEMQTTHLQARTNSTRSTNTPTITDPSRQAHGSGDSVGRDQDQDKDNVGRSKLGKARMRDKV